MIKWIGVGIGIGLADRLAGVSASIALVAVLSIFYVVWPWPAVLLIWVALFGFIALVVLGFWVVVRLKMGHW